MHDKNRYTTGEIRKEWDHADKVGARVKYWQAKDQLEWALDEVDRLHRIEAEKNEAEYQLSETVKLFKNTQAEMVRAVEAAVRKYDPYQG